MDFGKLKLILQVGDNWWRTLIHAWSIRLVLLAAVLSGIEFILPIFMNNPPIPRGCFAAFSFIVSIAACYARLVAQEKVNHE